MGLLFLPSLSSDPHRQREVRGAGWGGGWRRQGSYVKSKLQKTTFFIEVKSLNVPLEYTHLRPPRCLDNSEVSRG